MNPVEKKTKFYASIAADSERLRHSGKTPLLRYAWLTHINVVKTTRYFDSLSSRTDRAQIEPAWIERVITNPEKELIQADGRIRRWGRVLESGNRYLRVILLADGETVHNAFFDRGFKS